MVERRWLLLIFGSIVVLVAVLWAFDVVDGLFGGWRHELWFFDGV